MLISLNKPSGITSHDVINQVRGITGVKRVGHAGTLDPLATGLLVVGIGREDTKKLYEIMNGEKEYEAVIVFGAMSDTDDADGKISQNQITNIPTQKQVLITIERFIGNIDQKPPQYSAIKYHGKRAHQMARLGKKMNLGTRRVTINKIEVLAYQWPELKIRVVCGSGTYIRSLARDIGEVLGVGGYIKSLTRIRVGEFTLDKAISLEEFGVEEAREGHNDTIGVA